MKRSTIQLTKLDRELRIAQAKLAKAGAPGAGATGETLPPAASAQLAELNRKVDDLTAANQRLTQENGRLTAAVAAPAPGADTAALEQRAHAAETALAEQTAAATKTGTELADLRRRMEEQGAALDKSQAALASAQKKVSQTAPGDIARRKQLEDDLATTRMDLVSARRETEDLRAQSDAAKADLAIQAKKLQSQLAEAAAQAKRPAA